MKILVTAKRVVDSNVEIRVRPDGSGVELTSVKLSMSPFDEIAVEEAIRLKEQSKVTEVVAVSVELQAALETPRTALAMGIDREIQVRTERHVEPLSVAKILVKVVEREAPQLVLLGKQAIGEDSDQTGQMLGALLGWLQGTLSQKVAVRDGSVENLRKLIEPIADKLGAAIGASRAAVDAGYAPNSL